jgi:hypothetical protein
VYKEKENSVPSVPPGNVTDENRGGTLGHFIASRQRPERPATSRCSGLIVLPSLLSHHC